MTEVIWNMSRAPYSLDETGDAKVITAQAVTDARTFFEDEANKDTTLVLYYPPGVYHFYGTPTTSESAAITVISFVPGGTDDEGRLVFRGAGMEATKFIVYNNQSHDGTDSTSQWGPLFRFCRRITMEHFHLTVSQQTVSQGIVQSVGTGYVDLFVPPGFATPGELEIDPSNDAGKFLRQYTYEFDIRNPRIVPGEQNEHAAWTSSTDQGGGVWRINMDPNTTVVPYPIGSVVAIKGKAGKDPIRVVSCFNITMNKVRFSRKTRAAFIDSPDSIVTGIVAERETINGVVACLSSPEGGPQFQNNIGGADDGTLMTGTIVSGCRIIGPGDDCIGLFDQSGMVIGNHCQDSFARGIFIVRGGPGCTEAEVEPNNALVRCEVRTFDDFDPEVNG